jgi:hypothetical protein
MRGRCTTGEGTAAACPVGTSASCADAAAGRNREGSPAAAARAVACRRPEAVSTEAVERAGQEIAFCEALLAKGGLSVLSETFRDHPQPKVWEHYPPGDVFDPASGSQWFYHCHPAEEGLAEHGHFHCFLRPQGKDGPVHHLVAIGVNAHGRATRLFTVNQWVVGDDWLDAAGTIPLLGRFDMQMPRPSYLVNRWLTAMIVAHEDEIAALVRQRDARLAAHAGDSPREDRALEVTSELVLAGR